MADQITAKGGDSKFKVHEAGQFVATCVDTIDLGDRVETFAGKPPKLSHKCVLVFRTGERNEQAGEYIDVAQEFTVSMGEKSNLRKFLEQWRGSPYKAEQIEAGVPLHKLAGNGGLLTVAHKQSAQQRTYAVITACVGIPKQMAASVAQYPDYKRDEYWEARKKEYAEAARKFRNESAPASDEFDDSQAYDDADNSLPF